MIYSKYQTVNMLIDEYEDFKPTPLQVINMELIFENVSTPIKIIKDYIENEKEVLWK